MPNIYAITKILYQWMQDIRNATTCTFQVDNNGVLHLQTPRPGIMIGKGGVWSNKYWEALKQCRGITDVRFDEVHEIYDIDKALEDRANMIFGDEEPEEPEEFDDLPDENEI